MAVNVVLIGVDRQLAETLKQIGHEPRLAPSERLAELAAPGAKQPDVVILDLRANGTLPLVLPAFKREHPTTGVVVIAPRLDPMMMLEAMRGGVNEFLSDPVNPTDLEAAISRVLANRTGARGAQVFAFIGAKGGVGTTTIAVNVATTLAMLSAGHTLFLDLQMSGGDAAVFLGVEPKFSVVDALENSHRLDETFFRTLLSRTTSGLDVLASSEHLTSAQFDSARIRSLIEFVAQHYRFVVLDVPRLHPLVLDALDPAAHIVVVTSQEVSSVRGGAKLWATLSHRYGKEKVRVVVGRASARLTEISREDIERALGTGIRHEIPSDYELAVQAVNSGRPLALQNHNELSSSITALARELAGLADAPGDRRGLFGRFTGRR